MKKLIVTTLLTLALSTQAGAESMWKMGEGKPAPDFDRLAQRLELDASQTEAFKATMQAQHEKRKAMRQAAMQSMKESREALNQETQDQLSSVLTTEQLAELKEIQAQRHQRGSKNCADGKRGHGKRHAGTDSGDQVEQ